MRTKPDEQCTAEGGKQADGSTLGRSRALYGNPAVVGSRPSLGLPQHTQPSWEPTGVGVRRSCWPWGEGAAPMTQGWVCQVHCKRSWPGLRTPCMVPPASSRWPSALTPQPCGPRRSTMTQVHALPHPALRVALLHTCRLRIRP